MRVSTWIENIDLYQKDQNTTTQTHKHDGVAAHGLRETYEWHTRQSIISKHKQAYGTSGTNKRLILVEKVSYLMLLAYPTRPKRPWVLGS